METIFQQDMQERGGNILIQEREHHGGDHQGARRKDGSYILTGNTKEPLD